MYTSGGDLNLELPTGQQGGTHNLWVGTPFRGYCWDNRNEYVLHFDIHSWINRKCRTISASSNSLLNSKCPWSFTRVGLFKCPFPTISSQEIPPFETKGVMRASFSSRDADNHTAFIRIKTNASDPDQFIILPVEVEVTSGRPSSAPSQHQSAVSHCVSHVFHVHSTRNLLLNRDAWLWDAAVTRYGASEVVRFSAFPCQTSQL